VTRAEVARRREAVLGPRKRQIGKHEQTNGLRAAYKSRSIDNQRWALVFSEQPEREKKMRMLSISAALTAASMGISASEAEASATTVRRSQHGTGTHR
jgi:hypothetical protein